MTKHSAIEIARAAWAPDMPDWVGALAAEAERTSGARVAARIGVGASTVSEVLRRKYRGVMSHIEDKVRAALMRDSVPCPEQGTISGDRCLSNQKAPFSTSSPAAVRLWRACRTCPHSNITGAQS